MIETRKTLDRFSIGELQRIHAGLLGKFTGDNIKRRLALKLWRHVESNYKTCAPLLDSLAGRTGTQNDLFDEPPSPIASPTDRAFEPLSHPCLTCGGGSDHKCCPRCSRRVADTDIVEAFGVRTVNGKVRPQSYCLRCRRESAKENRDAKRGVQR